MTQINDLNSGSLGDLTDALADHSNVVDFSWLEGTNGETKDNYPSESERLVIPQLQEQWRRDLENSPNRLVPGQVSRLEKSDKGVSPEEKVEVERVAKKAMMMGLSGKDLVLHLRERFSSDTIDAAKENLKKVASEEGLLGNVYLDLSAFNTTKEALSTLGHHKIRLASFAVGAPSRERNYVDQTGKCMHLAKTVVGEVEYTPALLNHYASHLRNIGAIPFDQAIESKESLRMAFIQARLRKATIEASNPKSVSDTGLSDKSKALLESGDFNKLNVEAAKVAADVRIARVRPVLAKIQNFMMQGHQGEELKRSIKACCDDQTVQEFLPEISSLVSRQGLVGPVLADASYYGDVNNAVSAIGKAPVRPMFIIGTLPTPEGFLGNVSTRTGIPVMEKPSDFTHDMASKVVALMHGNGGLDTDTAHSLMKMASEKAKKPSEIVTLAAKAKAEKAKPVVKKETKGGVPAFLNSTIKGDKDGEKDQKRKDLKDSAQKAITKGNKASKIQAKLASYVPVGEAIGIMREALAAMSAIPVEALDECQSTKYALKKEASLIGGSKCSSCVFSSCGTCSKQGRPFRNASVRTASVASEGKVDHVTEMGLVAGSMDIDLSGIITPARTSFDVSLPGNSFGNLSL
jgi:hypothetical protein